MSSQYYLKFNVRASFYLLPEASLQSYWQSRISHSASQSLGSERNISYDDHWLAQPRPYLMEISQLDDSIMRRKSVTQIHC